MSLLGECWAQETLNPPPMLSEYTDKHCKHCVQALIDCWFSSMTVWQQPVVRPASVELTGVHMYRKEPAVFWYSCSRLKRGYRMTLKRSHCTCFVSGTDSEGNRAQNLKKKSWYDPNPSKTTNSRTTKKRFGLTLDSPEVPLKLCPSWSCCRSHVINM